MVGSFCDNEIASLRERLLPEVLVERTALLLRASIKALRDVLAEPLLISGSIRWPAAGRRPRGIHVRPAPHNHPCPEGGPHIIRRPTPHGRPPGGDLDRVAGHLIANLERSPAGTPPTVAEMVRMSGARGDEVDVIAHVAVVLPVRAFGDQVTYVINRNISATIQWCFGSGFLRNLTRPSRINARETRCRITLKEVMGRFGEA